MAKYRITAPDGGTYEVTAPDTASEAEVLAYAQQNYQAKPTQAAPKQEPLTADPTGSTLQNMAAGAGKAIMDAGRGVALRSNQALSSAPLSLPLLNGMNRLLEATGLSPRAGVDQAKAGIAESRKRDAPLMDTGGGIAGNFATNALMLAPTAAANTPGAAGMVGGMVGAMQPSVDAKEGAINTVLGAAGGAAGQFVANKVPGLLQARADKAAKAQAGNEQKFIAARAAAKEGYVIPPADLEPGAVSEAVSGLSGKIKTAQVASQRNQQVTNNLARREIGLADDVPLTTETLDGIRAEAGKAYGAVANLGKLPTAGAKLPKDVAVKNSTDMLTLSKRSEVDAAEVVRAWKQANHDATGYYRAYARDANPETQAKAKAAAAAAKQIDEFMTSSLEKMGNQDMVQAIKEARVLIAKTHTVEKALNPQTGDVSAQVLAKELTKGKKLSGGLLVAAKAGQAFPKATQALKEAPKQLSPLDFAVASTTGLATGNPLAAVLLGARPLARNALLSGPVQARALQQATPVPFTQATKRVLENRLAQALLGPVGTATGVQVGQ